MTNLDSYLDTSVNEYKVRWLSMGAVKITSDIDRRAFKDFGILCGEKETKRFSKAVYRESQANCPVKSGKLKRSGYCIKKEKSWEVGYTADYAELIDSLPSSSLGANESAGFFSNAVENQKGGGTSV